MLYNRYISVLASGKQVVTDLSSLRCSFHVRQSEESTPNTAEVRLYNLGRDTAARLGNELDYVSIDAGYADGHGLIFAGEIVNVLFGREGETDTFALIRAGDGEGVHNRGFVSATVPAGTNARDTWRIVGERAKVATKRVADAYRQGGLAAMPDAAFASFADAFSPSSLPPSAPGRTRAKAMYGLVRDTLGNIAQNTGATWYIQDGVIHWLSLQGTSGKMAVLSPDTGIVGRAEQVEQGLKVSCLLNPLVRVGAPVKLERTQGYGLGSVDGTYRATVVEHFGDTRGNDWRTDIVCVRVTTQNTAAGAGAQ